MDIEKVLSQPESKTLEFKTNISSPAVIVKTIVAFANTAGGVLVIGRSPEGILVGIEDVFREEERVANIISESIAPAMLPDIEIVTVQGRDLLLVRVSHWKGPFYVKKLGIPDGVFIRLGSTSRPAGPQLFAELQRVLRHVSFDEQVVPEVDKRALDSKKIESFFSAIGRKVDENKLRSLGIMSDSSNGSVPTVGGLILFGIHSARETYCPDAKVRCARFLGKDKTHILDRCEIEGTILNAVDEVGKFIARNTRLSSEILEMHRKDISEYPPVAIREALINALVHADYSISGSHIQISIFENRLEIQSPGMFPFGFTMEDLKSGVSRVRNRVLVRVFRELHLMEEWGSGYSRIMATCRSLGCETPEWRELGTSIRVTFYSYRGKPQQETVLSYRQQRIMALFEESAVLSFRQIRERVQLDISERSIRYDLAFLRKQGYLFLVGKGPSAMWQTAR